MICNKLWLYDTTSNIGNDVSKIKIAVIRGENELILVSYT